MATKLAAQQQKRTSVKSFFPILDWLPKYDRSWLRGDIIAAITVWALLVPEAMAYAGIAGMPPEAGLYTAPLALLAYAIFGTSRQLNVGPSSTVAVMSAAVLAGMAVSGGEQYIALSSALAIVTGIILVLSGLLRLGVLADFLSKPVLGGFIIGLAISIAVSQLDKLLGYSVPNDSFIPDVLLMLGSIGQIHWGTFIVGILSLAGLFLLDRYLPKVPGAITVVAIAIVISGLLDLESYGIHVVGEIPAGLPPIGLPTGLSLADWLSLIPGAAAIALVGFAESVAAARQYATKYGYEIDANQEMIALGAANAGAGISSGFVVDGSLSKSAAADEAGAKSQMVSILLAVMVLITVLALTPLFRTLPEATLGAVVIHAVWHLIDFSNLRRYREIRAIDFWAAVVAMVGVLLFGILSGLLLAVTLSLLGLLVHAKLPSTAVLGRMPDSTFVNVATHPDATTIPGLLIFRFDEQIFFANASNFRTDVRAAVASYPDIRTVLIDAEAINDIDVTAIDMLTELRDELEAAGIVLRFARMRSPVKEYLYKAGMDEKTGIDSFYPSVEVGVQVFLAEQMAAQPAAEDGAGINTPAPAVDDFDQPPDAN